MDRYPSGASSCSGPGVARAGLDTPVVVVEPDDVVLAEVRAHLHLDEDHVGVPLIGDAVRGLERDVDRLPACNRDTVPSRVTVAVPDTMNQCSARLA